MAMCARHVLCKEAHRWVRPRVACVYLHELVFFFGGGANKKTVALVLSPQQFHAFFGMEQQETSRA